jgi:hypothetical protein
MALRIFRVAGPMLGSLRREAGWASGTYLSDGKRLLRVIFPLSPPSPTGLAELEDCANGELLLFTGRELWNLWLLPVRGRSERPRVSARWAQALRSGEWISSSARRTSSSSSSA